MTDRKTIYSWTDFKESMLKFQPLGYELLGYELFEKFGENILFNNEDSIFWKLYDKKALKCVFLLKYECSAVVNIQGHFF